MCPFTLTLGAEVTTDRELARSTLPDGRKHGCAANTISAVARGHGRDNNAGVMTAVLWPIVETFGLKCGDRV